MPATATKSYSCPHCEHVAEITISEGDDHYICPACHSAVQIPAGDRPVGIATMVGGLLLLAIIGGTWWSNSSASEQAREGFPKIQTGMSLHQVQELMGEPRDTQHNVVNAGFGDVTTDCWYWNDLRYQICFENGRVMSKAAN